MALRFFHLRGVDEVLDQTGCEVDGLDIVRSTALRAARDVMSGDVREGKLDLRLRIDVETQDGAVIYSLPFARAISLFKNAEAA
ncbi:hypothetical protein [Sphingomonas sp. BK235]|uniref:DUF6894 family protein n=1 Tax=Sphingomonas sp. BK235 TaxID=2512131 RepID=UPI001048E6A3|nr:hypothetical protein [Sphingomonas sp. BK235]TCP36103.1 hypothetical protein EV292_102694 [Sphingomonas sp. BK235]